MDTSLRIGISSCLLGQNVRYDGGHKHDRYCTDVLGCFCTFVPVCPEVGCGLPVPRESMRLEGDPANPRLITTRSRIDLTGQMQRYCAIQVQELEKEGLCGFIFKKDSPSSGLFRVKVYNDGAPAKNGQGLFAAAMTRHFPLMPMEEEGRLHDPQLRENFIERIFSYHRYQEFLAAGPTLGRLVAFHTAHKLLMMAHSPEIYRRMGALVANGRELPLDQLLQRYGELFMKGLSLIATASKQTNVLQHMMGYFKRQLSREEKEELLEVITQYQQHLVPLVVPLTLLNHYIRKYDQPYLKGQVYLSPHPAQLMLRNHV